MFAGAQRWVRDLARLISEMGYSVALVDTNYGRISAAKMDGLQAYCSSILSDHLDEHLDYFGIGRFMAMTNNDGVNALAAKEFSHLFGRKNSFQLPPDDAGTGKRTEMESRLRGRDLFRRSLERRGHLDTCTNAIFASKKPI